MTNITNQYETEISGFNSAGIRHAAEALGITHIRKIGGGYFDGRQNADYYVGFYALPHPSGWEFRVANTNADPVWEEADQPGFAELAAACGVEI